MNQTWLFVCRGKIKNFCWAFLDGPPVQILKLSHQDKNQKCKAAQANQIHFLEDLTQICTQKCNQLLNFPLHTESHVWFISGWRPEAYILGFMRTKNYLLVKIRWRQTIEPIEIWDSNNSPVKLQVVKLWGKIGSEFCMHHVPNCNG